MSNQTSNEAAGSKKRTHRRFLADVFGEMSSKADLYDHMKNHLQFHMVSYDMFTKDFCKALLTGSKRLLKAADVKAVSMPKVSSTTWMTTAI